MQHVFYFRIDSLKRDMPWAFDEAGEPRDGYALYTETPYNLSSLVSAGDSIMIRRDYPFGAESIKSLLVSRFRKVRLLNQWVVITDGNYGDTGCVGVCRGVKLGEERGVQVAFGMNLEMWTGKAEIFNHKYA